MWRTKRLLYINVKAGWALKDRVHNKWENEVEEEIRDLWYIMSFSGVFRSYVKVDIWYDYGYYQQK